jgi:hypothetical protein
MATLFECFTYTDQHLNEVEEGREPIYRSWSGSTVLSSGKEASYTGIGVQNFIPGMISFIFIPWIRTGLQNPYRYGNSQICLRNLEVKSNSVQNVAKSWELLIRYWLRMLKG